LIVVFVYIVFEILKTFKYSFNILLLLLLLLRVIIIKNYKKGGSMDFIKGNEFKIFFIVLFIGVIVSIFASTEPSFTGMVVVGGGECYGTANFSCSDFAGEGGEENCTNHGCNWKAPVSDCTATAACDAITDRSTCYFASGCYFGRIPTDSNLNGTGSTSWNSVDVNNVTNPTLVHEIKQNKLKFLGNLNASGRNFTQAISFGDSSVYVNISELGDEYNGSANITFVNLPYDNTPVILMNGEICNDCGNITYDGENISFTVSHFTNYSVGANSELTIYDSAEDSSAEVDNDVIFYANYTNSTSGDYISGANCNITFDDGEIEMSEGNAQYNYTRAGGFNSSGLKSWTVNCSASGYESLGAVDNVLIAEAGTITVTYPNGGENWNKGDTYDITWTNTSGIGANVKLELYKFGSLHANITTSVVNTNSYTWVVPSTVDDDYGYKIKVSDVDAPSTNDLSDGDFSMGAAGDVNCMQYSGTTNQQSACEADGCIWETNITDSWCPFGGDGGCCLQKECWQYDGNETACENMTLNGGLNCIWDQYASYTEPDGTIVTGLCFNDFQGGEDWGGMSDGCWNNDGDKNSCQSSENAASCTWKPNAQNENPWCWIKTLTDAQNENPSATSEDIGCCDMKGCWDYDGNQTTCEGNAAFAGLCEWVSSANDPYCPNDVGCCVTKWCDQITDETNCTKMQTQLYMPCEWSNPGEAGVCQDQMGGGFGFFNDTDSCMNQGGWYNSTGDCVMPFGDDFGGGAGGFMFGGDAHCWFADDQPGVCGNITGCAYCVAGSGANGVDNLSDDNICKDVQAGWCEGHVLGDPTYSNADNTVNLNCSHIQIKAACNYGPLPNCIWSNSSTITGAFCEAGTSTERKAEPPAQYCEDPVAKNNYTICMELKEQFMMPCKWDNTSYPIQNCTFNSNAVFGSGEEIEFEIINSEFSCTSAGGTWQKEYYLDADVLKQDSWCEMTGFFDIELGGGQNNMANCDTSCWACEFQNNGSNWADSAAAEVACNNSALGYCEFTASSNAFNGFGWCDYPNEMESGGAQDCDIECEGCNFMNNPQNACEGSQANDGTGCNWVSEGSNNYCVDKTKKICSNDCFSCYDVDACQNSALSCSWDTINNLCAPDGFTGEICFNGQDDDSDNMIDCDDPDCGFNNFCGGGDIGGDCFAQTTEGECNSTHAFEDLNCTWINDTWNPNGWCDMPGANCWQFDNDMATCGATSGCTNESTFSGSVCDLNKTAMDTANCWGYNNESSCGDAPGDCSWMNDTYCQDNPSDPWCIANPNSGWCDYTPFASCMELNESSCDSNSICTWKTDDWGEMGGWCDVACFDPNTNQSSCEAINGGGLCEWRDMSNTCQPEMFMMMGGGDGGCWQYDGNETGCDENNVTCSYEQDSYAQNNVSGSEPSGWCMGKSEFNMACGINDFMSIAIDSGNIGEQSESGVSPEIDMDDLGMFTIGDTYGFAAGVFEIQESIICNGFMVDTEFGGQPTLGNGSATSKFYFYLDADGVETGGCNAPLESGTNLTGFDFLLSYVAMNTSSGVVETKQLMMCSNGGWNPTNALVTTPKMHACGFTQVGVSVAKQDLESFSLFNKEADMRIVVTSANGSDSRASPSDSVGPGYYTPGTNNFEFVDCSNPDNAQDPKCKNFQKFGFNIFEECKNGIDDDENGLVDCDDPFCSFIPDCASGDAFNFVADATDKTAPVVMFSKVDKLHDAAFVKIDTSEPSNLSLAFYGNDSTCTTLNETINDVGGSGYQANANFKPFHAVDLMEDTLGYDLINNTVYYYKVTTCDPSSNCGTSACLNLTTKTAAVDKEFIFKMDLPDGFTVDIPALNKTDYNFTETFNISGTPTTFDVGIKTNTSVTKNMNMTIHCGDMAIGLYGINMLKPTKIEMDNAFVCDEDEDMIGMNSTSKKWNKLIDELHLGGASDYVELTLPVTYDADNTLNWTDDSGENGEDVDDYVECAAGDVTGTTDCKIPVSMGFSAYKIETPALGGGDDGDDGDDGDGGSGGGGAGVTATEDNETTTGEDNETGEPGTGEDNETGEPGTGEDNETGQEGGEDLTGQAFLGLGELTEPHFLIPIIFLLITIVAVIIYYVKEKR